MRVLVVGAGAMGGTYGLMLQKAGNEVTFIDPWIDNLKKINADGFRFMNLGVEEHIPAQAYLPEAYIDSADLVILFTKSMQLEAMLETIKPIFQPRTKVLCLLNGLGHTETLLRYVQPENLLMGITVMTASMQGPADIAVSSYGRTEIQQMAGDRVVQTQIVELINKSGLPCVSSDDVMYSIWRKACLNGVLNTLATILEANFIGLSKIPDLRSLIEQVVSEFALVANTKGVVLNEPEIVELILGFTVPEFSGATHYPSMYQDLIKNHRLTEIDYLNGYVSREAKVVGVQTPYCDLITQLIHAKERLLTLA
ncbi:MAG: 2-dehydropantoate 2-reductase [Alcaligenaceae bacterium]|nr:2-dehydropantoate 2-reductase [Alcaligenaceae bacterium]